MIRPHHRLVAFLMLVGGLPGQPSQAARWGLLIEIGHYPPGRPALHSSRDRYWLETALHRQQFDSVHVLQDRDATAQGIRIALNQLLVRCRPGDKLVIHYGGHGTQLPDQDGDEARADPSDHLDEALVPYDAPAPNDPARYRSGHYIRDDELGLFLGKLQAAVAPLGHVLVLLDACHSGTANRGQAPARTDNLKPYQLKNANNGQPDRPTSGWFDPSPATFRTARPVGSLVMITGVRAEQTLHEVLDSDGQWVGPIAYFFSQALETVDEQATYQSLFSAISQALRRKLPMQTPTLEGNASARLLGGDLILPTQLNRFIRETGTRFRLLKGMLLGYGKGATVGVRVVRGDTLSQRLTSTVVEATPFESVLELADSLPVTDSLRLQTELLSQAFQPGNARVTLTGFRTQARQTLEAALRQVPGIQFVPNGADWLIRPVGRQLGLYRASDGTLLEQHPASQLTQLASRVTAYARANWLRDTDMNNPAMRVSVELIPVRLDIRQEAIQNTLPVEMLHGFPVLYLNQQAWLTIRNVGTVPFYFSVIDILPDADIVVGLPNGNYPAASLRLMPGQARSFAMPEITPPLGLETYKLLLSNTPVNLRTTVQTRGNQTDAGAQTHPLTLLLASRFRGGTTSSLSLTEAGTGLFQFWISQKK